MRLPPWHVHADVLLLAIALEAGYLWAISRLDGGSGAGSGNPQAARGRLASRRQVTWYTSGVAVIAVASSWPIHDLAEGYLFSVHMVQHMLISLVAPPMLLLGMPPQLLRKLISPRPFHWLVRNLARPFIAMVLFNLVIVVTHWPPVVNAMLEHHPLHFFGHAVLFGTATLMWWPVVGPLPELPVLSYPGRMLYLFLQSIVPTVPASFLTFGSQPLYHFYATVPRIWGISVLTDQLIAGLIMKLGGGAVLWGVITAVFFRWYGQERSSEGWDALKWRDVEQEIRSELSRR